MISQIDIEKTLQLQPNKECLFVSLATVLNHVVDVVNELQAQVAILQEHVHPTAKTPVDPYAEQRKWIGCLCWFWDDDYDLKTIGVLEDITTIEEEFHYAKKDTCTVWKHCKPVKPDDPIIYKGGDNE